MAKDKNDVATELTKADNDFFDCVKNVLKMVRVFANRMQVEIQQCLE